MTGSLLLSTLYFIVVSLGGCSDATATSTDVAPETPDASRADSRHSQTVAVGQDDADQDDEVSTTEDKELAALDAVYGQLLRDAVTADGLVRYDLLAETVSRGRLVLVVEGYASISTPKQRDAALAFLCNGYNANVLLMALDESRKPEFKTVLDVPGFFDKRAITVGGKPMTLNDLENKVIRPFGDARIHAALVCAAMSCPPLRSEPFNADRLDEQLADQATRWVNDPTKNRLDRTGLEVSRIMEWYGEDFTREPYLGVAGFIRTYAKPDGDLARALAENPRATIRFLDYDWTLNQAR